MTEEDAGNESHTRDDQANSPEVTRELMNTSERAPDLHLEPVHLELPDPDGAQFRKRSGPVRLAARIGGKDGSAHVGGAKENHAIFPGLEKIKSLVQARVLPQSLQKLSLGHRTGSGLDPVADLAKLGGIEEIDAVNQFLAQEPVADDHRRNHRAP